MFDVEELVAGCRAALAEDRPMLAVRDLLERAVAEGAAVEAALPGGPGVDVLHRSDDLTVLRVHIPAGRPATLPHDHRVWAVVGVYGGQEDNTFFRRVDGGLEDRGGRSVRAGDVLAMGDDAVHAIHNPSSHAALGALHVYGGDLVAAERSMWTLPGYDEHPYEELVVHSGPVDRLTP